MNYVITVWLNDNLMKIIIADVIWVYEKYQ